MFKFIKRLFKRAKKVVVHKNGKAYKFKTFEKAIAFMMMG